MAGFEAGFNAGAAAKMIDQPKAGSDQGNDNDGGGEVLQGAPVFVLIFQVAHRVDDFGWAPVAFWLAHELNDLGTLGHVLGRQPRIFLILAHSLRPQWRRSRRSSP